MTKETETKVEKITKIGKFKPKEKFIEFVGTRGNIQFISNEAFIEARYLSGLDLDGVILKLTICDEGTVDFEEVGTDKTTHDQRERLLDIINEKSTSFFNKKTIITDLPFKSVQKFKDQSIGLYLSVEYQTPISKLASIFDNVNIEMSTSQSSKLDDLLSDMGEPKEPVEEPSLAQIIFQSESDEEFSRELEGESDVEISLEKQTDGQKAMADSFNKMKEEKIEELTKRLTHQKNELVKTLSQREQLDRRVLSSEDDIKVLCSRIDSLMPVSEPNGYYFFVSEEMNKKDIIEDSVFKIIRDKISKIKSINVDGFMKLFQQGEYQIRLGVMSLDKLIEISNFQKLNEGISKSLSEMGIVVSDDRLTYFGDSNWHDIVNMMIKSGFTQNCAFDKMCGSNSYSTEQPNPEEQKNKNNMIQRFNEFSSEESEDIKEVKEEFEETNGYPMGDEFIFAMGDSDGDPDFDFWLAINPKSYWDSEHVQYDQHIHVDNGGVLSIPPEFEELDEGTFMYNGSDVECIKKLVDMGIKFNSDFQDFMEAGNISMGVSPYHVGTTLLADYMSQNYPQSIV